MQILEIQQNPRGTYNKSIRGQTTPSREDEQKHSKLAAENEEIKKQLKQVGLHGDVSHLCQTSTPFPLSLHNKSHLLVWYKFDLRGTEKGFIKWLNELQRM